MHATVLALAALFATLVVADPPRPMHPTSWQAELTTQTTGAAVSGVMAQDDETKATYTYYNTKTQLTEYVFVNNKTKYSIDNGICTNSTDGVPFTSFWSFVELGIYDGKGEFMGKECERWGDFRTNYSEIACFAPDEPFMPYVINKTIGAFLEQIVFTKFMNFTEPGIFNPPAECFSGGEVF